MIPNFICVCHVNDINLTQILLGSTGNTKNAHEIKRPKEDGHKQKSSDKTKKSTRSTRDDTTWSCGTESSLRESKSEKKQKRGE